MNRSSGRDVQYGAALAFAYRGDVARAQALTEDLGKRFPEDTIVQFNFLPPFAQSLRSSAETLPKPSRISEPPHRTS
jgi:hypothetical protein